VLIILSDPHKREWLYLINTQDNFKRFLWKGQASYKKSITYRDKGSVKDKSWNVMATIERVQGNYYIMQKWKIRSIIVYMHAETHTHSVVTVEKFSI